MRNSIRSLLLLLLLTTGMCLLFMGIHLSHSLKKDTTQYFETSAFQLSVYFPENRTAELKTSLLNVNHTYPVYSKSIFPLNNTLSQAFTLKYLPHSFRFPESHILSGKVDEVCSNCLWINQGLLPQFEGINLGDTLNFHDNEGTEMLYEFRGVVKELGIGGAMYTYRTDLSDSTYSELWLAFDQALKLDFRKKREELEHFFEERGIPISGIVNNQQRLQMLRDHLKPTFITIQAMGIFGIICGLLGLGVMINIQLDERKGEIGLLSALGASENRIAQVWLKEILLLNIVAIIIGSVFASYGAASLCEIFGYIILHIPISFFPNWFLTTLLSLCLLIGQLVIGSPLLLRLIRKTAYERLNQGVE